MDSNHFTLIRALSRLVTACEAEQQGLAEDAKPALLRAVAQGRAVLQEVVQGAKPDGVAAGIKNHSEIPNSRFDTSGVNASHGDEPKRGA